MKPVPDSMVFAEDDPDINHLAHAYDLTISENEAFFTQCQQNRDWRNNKWPGKSDDLRKNQPDAFPWEGASDQEVNVIGERVDSFVAIGMNALDRSHIKAYATKMESMPKATSVSSFMKWLQTTGIPNFRTEMEKTWNFGLEKGLMISHVGWKKESRTRHQLFSLDQIAEASPEIAGMIEDGTADDDIAAMLVQAYPGLKEKRAKRAVKDLRNKGEATLVVPMPAVNEPEVEACLPDGEVFFPYWASDPQDSPYVFWRRTMTAQELRKKVAAEGWNEQWVNYVIDHLGGKGTDSLVVDTSLVNTVSDVGSIINSNPEELYLIVYAYQRLIDEDDDSEGIYRTVFSPFCYGPGNSIPQDYAVRELMNGFDCYPFIVTRLSEPSKRLYDIKAMPEQLRGPQWGVKVERDSRIDRASLTTLPPRYGPAGRNVPEWGPGRYIPVRRPGEYGYMETPGNIQGSVEVERTLLEMADRAVGLDYNVPNAQIRQQWVINKLLYHVRDVLKLVYKCYQRFGPDQIFFAVTGVPDPVTLDNIDEEEFNITINFDTLSTDPETMQARAEQMASLMSMDISGRIDRGRYTEYMAYVIAPDFADFVLLPAEENQQKLVKTITDDFAKLFGGVAVGAQPNGAQVTLQMMQQWMSQQDVAQRYEADEAFRNRVDDYRKQAEFQISQAQNAEIGRIGTAPAAFQGTNVGP